MSAPTVSTAARIGVRLRSIRAQQGLSLADVQHRSDGRWKAVVVGAYERGDRAVTVARLAGLAAFYGVPLSDLLPDEARVAPSSPRSGGPTDDDVATTIDLTRLTSRLRTGSTSPDEIPVPDGHALRAVAAFVQHVRQLRDDHNGQVLTLREGDLITIALALGIDAATLRTTLDRHDVLREPSRW